MIFLFLLVFVNMEEITAAWIYLLNTLQCIGAENNVSNLQKKNYEISIWPRFMHTEDWTVNTNIYRTSGINKMLHIWSEDSFFVCLYISLLEYKQPQRKLFKCIFVENIFFSTFSLTFSTKWTMKTRITWFYIYRFSTLFSIDWQTGQNKIMNRKNQKGNLWCWSRAKMYATKRNESRETTNFVCENSAS